VIVGQQYKILSELGSGGMGIVYHGVDVMLEREVAIKKLRSEFSRTPDIAER
jgi:serine/threonine-protein kinase